MACSLKEDTTPQRSIHPNSTSYNATSVSSFNTWQSTVNARNKSAEAVEKITTKKTNAPTPLNAWAVERHTQRGIKNAASATK